MAAVWPNSQVNTWTWSQRSPLIWSEIRTALHHGFFSQQHLPVLRAGFYTACLTGHYSPVWKHVLLPINRYRGACVFECGLDLEVYNVRKWYIFAKYDYPWSNIWALAVQSCSEPKQYWFLIFLFPRLQSQTSSNHKHHHSQINTHLQG